MRNPCDDKVIDVHGLTLNVPPTQSAGGGAFNSSLSVGAVTPASPLVPGESIVVHFRLAMAAPHAFRYAVILESLPGARSEVFQIKGYMEGGTLIFSMEPVEVPGPKPKASASPLIISEFRLRGPYGPANEFVEIYNDSDSDVTVQAADGSAGYALAASDGVVRFIIPNGTVIPARGHFLGVNQL